MISSPSSKKVMRSPCLLSELHPKQKYPGRASNGFLSFLIIQRSTGNFKFNIYKLRQAIIPPFIIYGTPKETPRTTFSYRSCYRGKDRGPAAGRTGYDSHGNWTRHRGPDIFPGEQTI